MADLLDTQFAGPYSLRGLARGLRTAIVDPMVDDVRQGNRVLQEEHPLAYQAAQMHPAVGIPTAALNYADAMDAGDTEGGIKASLSAIPIAEKGYALGRVATSAPAVVRSVSNQAAGLGGGLRGWIGAIGRRTAAGENVSESFEAGQATGAQLRK